MKFSAAVVLAAASSALAASNVTVVTQTVQSLVTYCPAATTIVQNSKTYTVTKATTLTILDCPCTVVKTVPASTVPVLSTSAAAVKYNTTVPGVAQPTGATWTTKAGSNPTGTGKTSVPTAAGAKMGLSGLAGAVGLAAFLL
ncbi:unnamed protein product [Clonostachys byssicola]|uniref:Clock-controlled protein 6 n=1 Tax=Clonostachys byssicola TaxID=160290 RepID=A0A9N9UU86_9HYPO|nr:unnamed protein product [Clonostachys byssicola]